MKRVLAIVLALGVAMSFGLCFAGLAEAGETLEPVTLKVWLVGPGKQKESDEVWKAFNEMLADYLPNTEAAFAAYSFDEYATKWSTAMASGEELDLAWFGWVQNEAKEVAMGSLTPLSDLVETYCADAVELFGKDQLELFRYTDGELYVFPCWQGMVGVEPYLSLHADTLALMEDGWMANLESAMLATAQSNDVEVKRAVYDELTRYFEAVKQADMLRGGVAPNEALNKYVTAGLAATIGGDVGGSIAIGDDTFTLIPGYSNELMRLNWEYTARWYTEGYIRFDIASLEKIPTFVENDQENSTLNYSGGTYTVDRAAFLTSVYGFELASAKISNVNWISASKATCWCIPSTSANPERAAMLMNLLNAEKGKALYRTLTYGIEGKHWAMNEDGTATVFNGSGNSPTADLPYGQFKWVIGNIMNSLVTQSDTVGTNEYTKSLEAGAMVNPLSGFKFDNSECEALYASLNAIYKEYSAMFLRGYLGVEGFDAKYAEFKEKLESAGIEAYIAEVQRQIDAYVAEHDCAW